MIEELLLSAKKKLWRLHSNEPQASAVLAKALGVNAIVAQLLINRRVTSPAEAKLFLDAPMSALHAPQLLPGVPEAAARVVQAINTKEPICIYGDYDVDGTTGTAILVGLLSRLGAVVTFYVPHRLDEGYGLNEAALRELVSQGVKMVITVDCGITGHKEALVAKEIGLELIVTDHHEMKPTLPEAMLVHPRLPGSAYPFHGLSGSCVAFKLAWAIGQAANGEG